MSDVQKSPYAEWLEGMIREVLENKPVRIGVVMITEEGAALTGYYGERTPEEMATMAWHMNMDAVWEMVSVNADKLLIMGQELMEAGEDDGESE